GGAGKYQCEDAATSHATLCSNYPSYSVSPDQTLVECVCSSQSSDAGNPQDGGTVPACGQSVCTASQVCVHYPACTMGGSSTAGCASNDPSGFPHFCSNYGGRYSVDNSQTNVDCLCP